MKKKNYRGMMTLFITLSVVFIVLAIASFVVNHFLNLIKDPLIVMIVVASLLLLSILFIFLSIFAHRKLDKSLNNDITAIYNGLNNFQNGVRPNVHVQTDNPLVTKTVDLENALTFGPKRLNPETLYKEEEFLPFAKLVLEEEDPSKMAFIHLEYEDENSLKKMAANLGEALNNHPRIYKGMAKNALNFVVVDCPYEEIKESLKRLADNYPKAIIRVGFAPETSFDSFIKEIDESYDKPNYYELEGVKTHELAFNELISFYLARDLSDKSLLTQFFKDILPYVPFSHIALRKSGKFIRQVNWNNTKRYSEFDEKEFGFVEHHNIILVNGETYVLSFATMDNIGFIYKETKRRILVIKATLAAILAQYIDEDATNIEKERYENLLNTVNSYSYSINVNYDIIHTSKLLQNKYKESLLGQKCYKAFYNKKEPCANCPIKGLSRKVLIPGLGSNEITNIAYSNNDTFDVYLINNNANVVSKKAKLQERLLDLINNDYRGYLLCFKLDNLEDVARKGKVKESEVITELFRILKAYGLDGNLYQKEVDEFVYVLENTGSAEATEIAKRLALALDEKLTFNEKGYLLAPKVILLSYPLEVSTLFDLDSLSRTLYKEVDKKGRLYRIASNPYPIDKRRYYIEIIENSFKKDEIPFVLNPIKDRNGEFDYKELRLTYVDENDKLIPEDDITLYAKQENIYTTLIERMVKQIKFDESSIYVLPLYREGQNLALLGQINKALKAKNIEASRLLFMVQEKDIFMHLDFYKEARKLGYHFAYWTIENRPQGDERLDIDFVYASTAKVKASKLYQLRVTKMLNEGYSFRIEENALDYLKEARFLG